MLGHELAVVVVADRERTTREALRVRRVTRRRPGSSSFRRALDAILGRPPAVAPPVRSARALARDLGGAVSAVSARPGDTHGQGAC